MLLDLMPDNVSQGEFDFDAPETRDRGKLMAAMDAINDRFGRGAIHVGSAVGAGTPRLVDATGKTYAPIHHQVQRLACGQDLAMP